MMSFPGAGWALTRVLHAGPDPALAEIPEDPYIESTGFWQDISVDQSDDDVWKTTDMGWGVYPQGMRKMLNYIQVSSLPG